MAMAGKPGHPREQALLPALDERQLAHLCFGPLAKQRDDEDSQQLLLLSSALHLEGRSGDELSRAAKLTLETDFETGHQSFRK